MPALIDGRPEGVLRPGWASTVGDYAIAGDWAGGGDTLIVADAAGGIHGFDGKSGATRWAQRDAHPGGVLALAMHRDGATLAAAGQDGRVSIRSAADGRPSRTLDVSDGWIEHLQWSTDGRWLAASAGRQVHVRARDGREIWRSPDHPSTVSALVWSTRGELASACYGQVMFSALPTGEETQRLEWKGSLVSMALSPDGDIVACGSQDNSVHFWRRSTGQDSMMSGYAAKPSALAFDRSGTLLATGGGSAVTVWSFRGQGPEGTRPGVLDQHTRSVTHLAFAPRDMRLASASRDGTVVVWSLRRDGSGLLIGEAVVGATVEQVVWRPDGRALAALDARGGVTVWRVRPR